MIALAIGQAEGLQTNPTGQMERQQLAVPLAPGVGMAAGVTPQPRTAQRAGIGQTGPIPFTTDAPRDRTPEEIANLRPRRNVMGEEGDRGSLQEGQIRTNPLSTETPATARHAAGNRGPQQRTTPALGRATGTARRAVIQIPAYPDQATGQVSGQSSGQATGQTTDRGGDATCKARQEAQARLLLGSTRPATYRGAPSFVVGTAQDAGELLPPVVPRG